MSPHESVDLIPEEELYGLFERRRPEREAFRSGIEERIAARRDERSADTTGEPAQSSFWRRAAAFLPFDPFGGALLGSSLGKALGGKALSTALALPVMVLATVFGGFLAGTRSLRRSSAGAVPVDETARADVYRRGSRTRQAMRVGGSLTAVIQFGAMAAFLVTWLFGGGLAIDVLTLVLVLSMVALVVTVRAFARIGLLTRPDVTRLAVGILLSVFLGCFLWFHNMRLADDASSLGAGWPSSVVLLGVVACFLAGGQRARALVALILGLGFTLFLNTLGVTRTSHESMRSQLAGLRLDTGDLSRWREAAALHGALAAVGAELPDLTKVRARVALAMRSQDDVHPVVWTAAYQMGLAQDSDWRALAARRLQAYQLDQLQQYGDVNKTPYFQYFYPMLLATREVSPEQRENLARKVLESWPETGEHRALARAVMCVRVLDELERPDLVAGLRSPAQELLSAYWVSGRGAGLFAQVGGFTSNPEKFRTSFGADTLDGVELMARFGVPDEIDLTLLRSHLRRECHSLPLLFEALPYLNALPRASLLRLREEIGMPPRTGLEAVLAERLLIGTVLIVLLCLIAVRLAPAPIDAAALGARP